MNNVSTVQYINKLGGARSRRIVGPHQKTLLVLFRPPHFPIGVISPGRVEFYCRLVFQVLAGLQQFGNWIPRFLPASNSLSALSAAIFLCHVGITNSHAITSGPWTLKLRRLPLPSPGPPTTLTLPPPFAMLPRPMSRTYTQGSSLTLIAPL